MTRRELVAFTYAGERLPLLDAGRGIRNPAQLAATLTILSTPKGPYDDAETEDGLWRYDYRTGAPDSGDNRKLRRAADLGVPLILLRKIAERLTRLRLHQPVFRARVIQAYDRACAMCRLRHVDLLDAAHILSDADGGQPVVTNGLSLCKIHHAAYDRGILGVRPDYVVQVRPDVLLEQDGPMLTHGIQALHAVRLALPSRSAQRPDRDLLAQRFAAFTRA